MSTSAEPVSQGPVARPKYDSLSHFLRIASRGRRAGASGGEKRAAKIARVIVDEVSGLDGQAVEGLIDFIRGTARSPKTAQELFR